VAEAEAVAEGGAVLLAVGEAGGVRVAVGLGVLVGNEVGATVRVAVGRDVLLGGSWDGMSPAGGVDEGWRLAVGVRPGESVMDNVEAAMCVCVAEFGDAV